MAPGGVMFRYPQHYGENVLRHGSHEWLPYSKNEVRLQSSNTNLSSSYKFLDNSSSSLYNKYKLIILNYCLGGAP